MGLEDDVALNFIKINVRFLEGRGIYERNKGMLTERRDGD
jgi:hypothetical protein